MPSLIYFRQKRFDGGVRTGVELELESDLAGLQEFPVGLTLLEDYEEGTADRDPSLLWYVDIRCEGPGIPDDSALASQWFLQNKESIVIGLSMFADHLREVGADIDQYPMQWSEFPSIDGVKIRLTGTAVRRIDSLRFSEILDDIREHWSERMEKMILLQNSFSTGS